MGCFVCDCLPSAWAQIPDADERRATYQLIAAEQVKAGDLAGARETLALALESADRIAEDYKVSRVVGKYFPTVCGYCKSV